jgi:catechol 2,3-dioxygenase-like lactoylglutathione lyase family enzyme
MSSRIATVTLLVRDYDQAIAFYRDALGFPLIADIPLGGGKRWVVIGPPDGGARLLLARADGGAQAARVGDQTGGRVGFFLETDDFARDHAAFAARGVRFLEAPRHEPYGTVAVFVDLYGNKWDLIEPMGRLGTPGMQPLGSRSKGEMEP